MATERDAGGDDRPEDGDTGDRASKLAAAILRVSASLDLETVLREIVEGARGLTGARLGILATVDEPGDAQRPRRLLRVPARRGAQAGGMVDRLALFEHLRELPGPLRVDDMAAYVKRELGIEPPAPIRGAFQWARVRYRGDSIGYLYLGEKAGGAAFTHADEEVLLLFAAQAAAAIGNARAHAGERRAHDSERRARQNLEALIETSPVGAVVFDGGGRLVSSNREARRIVESLREPGSRLEDLLDVVVVRRADGREAPLAEQFVDPRRCARRRCWCRCPTDAACGCSSTRRRFQPRGRRPTRWC